MARLLVIKEQLNAFFEKYNKYTRPILKFVLAMALLTIINSQLAFFPRLNSIIVSVVLAAICAFLDMKFTVVAVGLVLILNTMQASLEVAIIEAILYLLIFLFYFRFSKSEAYVLLLMPIAFFLQIPYVIPLVIGLVGSLSAILPMCFWVIICNLIVFVSQNASTLSKTSAMLMNERFQFVAQRLFASPDVLIMMLACIITVFVVRFVSSRGFNFAWMWGVVSGSITNTLVILAGYYAFDTAGNIVALFLGEAVACVIGILIQLIYFPADYTRVERVQFEDDEYYYYVKAVPKMSISEKEVKDMQ